MNIYFLELLIMTMLGSVASLYLKKASDSDGIFSMMKSKNLYIGAFLYVLSAFLNIWILRFLDYSIVLPLTSFTYIWTMILAYFSLEEKISSKKKLGVLLILIGAVLVAK